jgi:hypothetical protein
MQGPDAPFHEFVSARADILTNFGNAMGFVIKFFRRSVVAPIRCNEIDLTNVLTGCNYKIVHEISGPTPIG